MTYVQDPPNSVQIEPTEGCNLRCPFCGLNGIRGKEHNFRFMSIATGENIARVIAEAPWNPRIEFAMHGEPTRHPNLPGLIAAFRAQLPKGQLMLTTNGSGLVKDTFAKITKLFQAGIWTFAIDEYQGVKWAQQIRENLRLPDGKVEVEHQLSARVFEYPVEADGNPHRRMPPGQRRLIFIAPIDLSKKGTHSSLTNHTGAGAPKNDLGMGKRCHRPFREISVRWDGSVAICCNDWRGEFVVGNVNETPIDELWQDRRFQAARRKLYHGERDFGPCKGCDAVSYRVGLLPDRMGKESLPPADADDLQYIADALADGPLTKPVLRPWEKV